MDTIDHRYYLELLGTAKDSLYGDIISRYDRHIARFPTDFHAQLERCRLINSAYYDTYEEYNPNGDQAESCGRELKNKFPDEPEVVLFYLDFFYGDSLRVKLEPLEEEMRESSKWEKHRWEIYSRLATYYKYNTEDNENVIRYGLMAMSENDTLDLSLIVAESYQALSQNEKATEIILAHLDSTDHSWDLNQKGSILLELGKSSDAIRVFRWVTAKGEDMENSGEFGQALIDFGLIEEARPYLLKEVLASGEWGRTEKVVALLEYDLTYGVADSASVNYRKLTDDAFTNDTFGIYRLRLVGKAPLAGWTFGDLGRLALLALVFVVILIVPYLWVLPIYNIGELSIKRNWVSEEPTFQWHLGHLWAVSSLWLASDAITLLIFQYQSALNFFRDTVVAQDAASMTRATASANLWFMIGLAAGAVALLKKADVSKLINDVKENPKLLWQGLGLLLILRFGLGIYSVVMKRVGVDVINFVPASASTDAVVSINTAFGPALSFVFVVLLVPFYEELFFRGIALSSVQRSVRFVAANCFQSALFALVHQSLVLFPFYFAFGMIAGHVTRRTGSLATGISMHVANNLLAWCVILWRT